MQRRFFLDVVIREGTSILELFTSKNQSLLIGWNSFLVLNLLLHIIDGVAWLNIKSDSFTSKSFNKNLHTSTKSKHEMKGRFFLNIVVRQSSAILKLLSCKD